MIVGNDLFICNACEQKANDELRKLDIEFLTDSYAAAYPPAAAPHEVDERDIAVPEEGTIDKEEAPESKEEESIQVGSEHEVDGSLVDQDCGEHRDDDDQHGSPPAVRSTDLDDEIQEKSEQEHVHDDNTEEKADESKSQVGGEDGSGVQNAAEQVDHREDAPKHMAYHTLIRVKDSTEVKEAAQQHQLDLQDSVVKLGDRLEALEKSVRGMEDAIRLFAAEYMKKGLQNNLSESENLLPG
jgi:hypothetical protein